MPFFSRRQCAIGYEIDYRMLHCTMSNAWLQRQNVRYLQSVSRPTSCATARSRLPAVAACAVPPVPSPAVEEEREALPATLTDLAPAEERGAEARNCHRPVANCGGGHACLVPPIERTPAAIAPARALPRDEDISDARAWTHGHARQSVVGAACRSRGSGVCGRALVYLVARTVEGWCRTSRPTSAR